MKAYAIKWIDKKDRNKTGYAIGDFSVRIFLDKGDAQHYLDFNYKIEDNKLFNLIMSNYDFKIIQVEITEIEEGGENA